MHGTHGSWADGIRRYRESLEAFFASDDGPLNAEERADFGGLAFYPADERFRVTVTRVTPVESDARELSIPTSDGRERWAERAARLEFELLGGTRSLYAYTFQESEPGMLFVPFLDMTSGTETYGAGRYLDVEAGPDGSVELDFNLAYQPYCAFSSRYSCPLTPAENRIAASVAAGERLRGEPGHA